MLLPRNAARRTFPSLQCNNPGQLRSVGSVAADPIYPENALRIRDRWRLKKEVPRTHVLTIPMYQNSEVWARLEEFRDKLRRSSSGTYLESGIIVPSINDALEFKLGNIVIKDSTVAECGDSSSDDYSFEYSQVNDLLQSLKSPIQRLIRTETQGGVLRVPLGRIKPLSFEGEFFDPQKVHLLQLEPHECPATETLRSVCRIAFNTFKNAGMLVAPPTMAPHLATTLINTKNRARHQGLPAAQRPKSQKRIPFNLEALYASEFFQAFHVLGPESKPLDLQQPINVDLGIANITTLCLRRVAMPTETKELIHDGKIDFAD